MRHVLHWSGTSFLTHTLCFQSLEQKFSQWQVITEEMHSDHRAIQMIFQAHASPPVKVRKWGSCNWNLLRDYVEEKASSVMTTWSADMLELEAKKFQRITSKAIDRACPLATISNPVPKFKWWSSDLSQLKGKMKKAQSKYRRFQSEERWQLLKDARQEYRKAIKSHKRQNWKEFLSDSVDPKMTALVNRIIRKKTNPPVGLLKDNNENFLGSKGSLIQLLNVHFPGNLKKDENPHIPHEVVESLQMMPPLSLQKIKLRGLFKASATLKHLVQMVLNP